MLDVCIPYAFRPVATRLANARSSCCHYCIFGLCSIREVRKFRLFQTESESVFPPARYSPRVKAHRIEQATVLAAQLELYSFKLKKINK